ncbi:hypothetical protein ATCM_00615 [Stenotrophomonas sp. ATCM1_4]|uniref:Uncharacterized protein n=1 Tax=Stenotrophomonas capsici TaxID=3110230 RepID=A0ABU5V6K0_9GAMM|nr:MULTISPECIES: hypothetical protein [unclassified Stenotrophomonas]MEA5667710.1 hypothetical protein [Stenotrophomonas sp. MH1]TDB26300.1 hypothetical protein ATCM_00615 [Stenotrophomonas sp. ATCM1_4]
MSNSNPDMNALGVLALELAGGQQPRKAALSSDQAGELAALVGRDLAKLVPQVSGLDLVFAAAHFDPAEVLRPGLPIHRRLEELQARAPGRNQGPRLLAFGADANGEVPLPLQADPGLVGGGLRVVPFVLTGTDTGLLQEARDALEEVLLANGMAQPDTALLAQTGFAAQIEHARYFTFNDLAAMMAMQYDNQGLADLWPLLETAMFAPGQEQWLEAPPEPLLRYVGGEVRMALFDPAGWCAHYGHERNACDRLQRVYEQYLMRQRQMAAVLEAHGIDVLYVHVHAGQDAKALLAH